MISRTGKQGAINAYIALEKGLREFIGESITDEFKLKVKEEAEKLYTKDGLYEINTNPNKNYITYIGQIKN